MAGLILENERDSVLPQARADVRREQRQRRQLLISLVSKELVLIYRGTSLGSLWTLLNPILMLLVYSFVFLQVFAMRWPGFERSEFFILNLFVGLMVHGWLAEVLQRAPGLILAEAAAIKKVRFPLEILPWVPVLTPMVQFVINLLLVISISLFMVPLGLHLLLIPLVVLPFILLITGMSFLLSSLGVYFRDLRVVISFVITALLFMSPIFYPVERLPQHFQTLVWLNPLTLPIEAIRGLLFEARLPNPLYASLYYLVSIGLFVFGRRCFKTLSKGFADVI